MAQALKLEVILKSVDKMTAPIRSALGAGRDLDNQIADLRKELLSLNKTQKNMTAFKELKVKISETGKSLEKTQANAKKLALQLKDNKITNQNLAESLELAQKRTQRLALRLADAEGPSKKLNKKFEEAQALTNKLTAQFRLAENATDRLSTRFENAKNTVNRLKNKQTQEIRSLDQLRTKFTEAGISSQRLTQAQRDIATQTAKATQALDAQAQKLKAVQAQQKSMNRLSYQKNRGMQMASNMTVMGAGGIATGRQVTQSALAPASVAMDFEEQMSKVQALTRLNKSDPAQAAKMAALQKQAMDLGASTSYSASEVAGAQSFLAMAGFDPEKIMKSMPGMLSLAKAAGTELAQTADISSNILSGFRLEADQMGRVGDVLTATFTRSNVDLTMLGESMKYAAPVAAELGVSLEETAAMAGLLGNVGIQASMAGTSMRAIFNRMAAPPKMAREALEGISVKATDAAGNMRAVPEILAEIAQKTEKMGNAQRMAIFKAVAGAEAGSAMATLVAKEGAEGITKFTKVLTKAGGEADRVAKIMGDNTKGRLKEAQSAWEGMQITLGTLLIPTINSLIFKVTKLTRGIQQWAKENPETAATIMKVAIGLGVLMAVMGGLTIILGSILGPMILLRFGLGMLGLKAGGLVAVLRLVTTVIRTLGVALLANPIILIVTAIALAAYLIYDNWSFLVNWWNSWTLKDVGIVIGKALGETAAWLLTQWKKFTAWWDGTNLKEIALSIPTDPVSLAIKLTKGFFNWWNKSDLPSKAANVISTSIDSAWKKAKKFANWWNKNMSLRSHVGKIKAVGSGISKGFSKAFNNGGARAAGGPVRPGNFYRVNENGPELLNMAGRSYLMASNAGSVTPLISKMAGGIAGGLALSAGMAMPAAAQIQSIQKAEARPAAISSQQSHQTTQQIEININAAPGMDEHYLAELVEQKLRALQNQQSDNRSGYLFDGADRS